MPKGFRPILEPPAHRQAKKGPNRPILCLTVTSVAVLFVVTIFGMTSWSVYEHRFDKNTFIFHDGDEVALSQVASDFSVTFCDSYKVCELYSLMKVCVLTTFFQNVFRSYGCNATLDQTSCAYFLIQCIDNVSVCCGQYEERVSLQGQGEVYLLSHSATVNTSFSDQVNVELYQLANREFNVRYTYLLRKSTVNVTACRNSGPISHEAEIVFIQGDNNFKKWRRNNFCEDCVLRRTHIPDYAFCGGESRHLPRLFYEVTTNDKYFLLVYNGRPFGERHHLLYHGVSLNGTYSRTHFDLSGTEKICHIVNDSFCQFELPWMSSQDLVVKFEGQGWSDPHYLITRCQMRIIFWVCLFGILPIVCISITLTLFGCYLCKRQDRIARMSSCQKGTPGERTKLLEEHDRQFTSPVPQNEENGVMAIQLCV